MFPILYLSYKGGIYSTVHPFLTPQTTSPQDLSMRDAWDSSTIVEQAKDRDANDPAMNYMDFSKLWVSYLSSLSTVSFQTT